MNYRQLQDSVYKNASMGVTALKSMIPMVSDSNVKNLLIRQYNGCKAQKELTARQMKEQGFTPSEPSLMSRMMTMAAINMQLRRDSSGSNAAKMAIKGTNTGIIELTEKLNHTYCSSPETIQSVKEYLRREQKSIESLKPYL